MSRSTSPPSLLSSCFLYQDSVLHKCLDQSQPQADDSISESNGRATWPGLVNCYCFAILESSTKKAFMRSCLDQDGLWAYLWGSVLITGEDLSTVGGAEPSWGITSCVRAESRLATARTHSSSALNLDGTGCFKICHPDSSCVRNSEASDSPGAGLTGDSDSLKVGTKSRA